MTVRENGEKARQGGESYQTLIQVWPQVYDRGKEGWGQVTGQRLQS